MGKVRVTVRAGRETITREGIGAGFGRASAVDAAHEIALKAAETGAKRALATFGYPFRGWRPCPCIEQCERGTGRAFCTALAVNLCASTVDDFDLPVSSTLGRAKTGLLGVGTRKCSECTDLIPT